MASLWKRGGLYSVRFTFEDERQAIALGTRSEDRAKVACKRIGRLVELVTLGEPLDDELIRWASKLKPRIRKKLEEHGLLEKQSGLERVTLGSFVAEYITKYGPSKKPETVTTWRQCERLLLEHFDGDKPLDEITAGDAEDFRNHLLTRSGKHNGRTRKPLAEATVRRRCGCAKAFLAYAVSKRLIDRNPFDTPKVKTTAPRSQQKAFIPPAMARAIVDKLPHAEFRLLFVLNRWGGLRVGSEVRQLRWTDIDFERKRIRFRAPKTEHHDGKGFREIPLWLEIEQALNEVEPSGTHVLPFLHDITDQALRKPMLQAIRAAGYEPWPKLWTTPRASRDAELREVLPARVVDAFMGHNQTIANMHYGIELTDDDFADAICASFVATKAPQRATTEDSEEDDDGEKQPGNTTEHYCTTVQVGDEGLEPPTSSV